MKEYRTLLMLIGFLVITYCYYPLGDKKEPVKEPVEELKTTINNDYAQAYDYCIKIRKHGK